MSRFRRRLHQAQRRRRHNRSCRARRSRCCQPCAQKCRRRRQVPLDNRLFAAAHVVLLPEPSYPPVVSWIWRRSRRSSWFLHSYHVAARFLSSVRNQWSPISTGYPIEINNSPPSYLIFVSAAISSLPFAVVIISRTVSPRPAAIAADTRFPCCGSAATASSNKTVSPRFKVTCNGIAGSRLTNWRFTAAASVDRLTRTLSFACVTLVMPTVGL